MVLRRQVIRDFLLRRDKVCRYCGEAGQEIEHVIPLVEDGEDDPFGNLVLACQLCNNTKGSEVGFELEANVLTWHGEVVEPLGLYGDRLMKQVRVQRLARQEEQGLTHIVAYKRQQESA